MSKNCAQMWGCFGLRKWILTPGLRDLRYPVVGLEITSGRYKTPQGFTRSTYTLHNWKDLPPNHRQLIRDWENPAKKALLKQQLGIA